MEQQQPPPPVFPADIDVILRQAKTVEPTDAAFELEDGNNYWRELFAEYTRLGEEIKLREMRLKIIKAEALNAMGNATKMTQDGQLLATAKLVTKKPETKPRPGYTYRDFRIAAGALE